MMNFQRIAVIVVGCLLSGVLFFCSKNQTPVSSTPPAVKILSFAPLSVRIGDQIVITGENFSADKTADSVFFTHGRLALIDSATTAKLYVRVPQGTITGTIVVRTGGSTDTSKQIFTLDTLPLPTIISLQPGSGPLGTIITITGTNFDTTQGHTIIIMNGVREKIISISPTKIVVEIIGGTTGAITITMNSDTLTAKSNFIVTKRSQTITTFSPQGGKIGTQVTITGTNFHSDTNGLVVSFGNIPAQVVSVSDTQILTIVPPGTVTAPITVSFFGEQATSETAFHIEGQYYFSFCAMQIGNVPVIEDNNGATDTTIDNYSFGFISRCDNTYSDDTAAFCYNEHVSFPMIDKGINVSTIRDTASYQMASFIYSEGDSYNDGHYNSSESEGITFHNLPYIIQGDSLLIQLRGSDTYQYFISGYHSYRDQATDVHTNINVLQFLPFTDSTYIKIVLN
ncbi:MAG TPA: IPT/TIG domain-containing protein [Candidatus Kapabacteria bacterium]|nr:IPT/TIG domain-containing protein [Candidatus Kapabacteria bacterium]